MDILDILDSENLAEELDETLLVKIGHKVKEGFDRDISSRSDWEERNSDALKLALQVVSDKNYPWPGASNVKYPLVTTACMQFNARAYPALVPGSKVVKHRVVGADPTGEKQKRALRVSTHMNYQLLSEDESWEDEMDRLLMSVPLLGTAFKKSYFDPVTGKNVSEMISADNFVTDYYTRSLETSRRKTHVLFPYKNDLISDMRLGLYKEYELSTSQYTPSKIREASDEAQGVEPPESSEDTPFQIIEQHCFLDLDEDGYEEPYIVTVLYDDGKVLRIVPRFSEESIQMGRKGIGHIDPDEYFTKFGFIPSPDGGFYDVGFGILLGPMNESVNTLINQLIDSGTLSNLQSGFISKGIRIKDGKSSFIPGEWKKTLTTGDDLRKGIFPLPVREPSQTLFQLLGLLIEAGQQIGSVSEMMLGGNPGQNQPATTSMAVLEQGLKVYSSIIKRIHRSLSSEFRKLYKLNSRYLNPETYFEVIDEGDGNVFQTDYQGDPKDISPVSDPNILSDAQRLSKAESVLARAQTVPYMYNVLEVERRYLEAINESGIDTILLQEDQIQPPTDPEVEFEREKFADESQRAWLLLDIESQTAMTNMRKKIADTERSLATIDNQEDKMELEIAKFEMESEFKRAEIITRVISEMEKNSEQRRTGRVEESGNDETGSGHNTEGN